MHTCAEFVELFFAIAFCGGVIVPINARYRAAELAYVIENGESQLVNYRVQGNYYIVDRLFQKAELRVGESDQTVVQIARKGD